MREPWEKEVAEGDCPANGQSDGASGKAASSGQQRPAAASSGRPTSKFPQRAYSPLLCNFCILQWRSDAVSAGEFFYGHRPPALVLLHNLFGYPLVPEVLFEPEDPGDPGGLGRGREGS